MNKIEPYLKTAADQLRRAAQAKHQETQEVRSAIIEKEQQTKKFKKELERQTLFKRAQTRETNDNALKVMHEKAVLDLKQQMTDAEKHLNQQKQMHVDEISIKEDESRLLQQKADEIEKLV